MRIFKKIRIIIIFICMFFIHIETTHAAFNISASASYDANTGVLFVYDAQFTGRSTARPERMLIGNVRLNGSYEFNDGVMKIFVRNKDEVNQQNSFDVNSTSTLYMEYGAVVRIYAPPGGINVVMESESNTASIGLGITMLRPKVSLENFMANNTSFSSKGGNISLSVVGKNLDKVSLKIYSSYNATFYPLSNGSNGATLQYSIRENKTQQSRTDVFTLYINDQPTNWVIHANIDPHVIVEDKVENEENQDKKPPNKNDDKTENLEEQKDNKKDSSTSDKKATSNKNTEHNSVSDKKEDNKKDNNKEDKITSTVSDDKQEVSDTNKKSNMSKVNKEIKTEAKRKERSNNKTPLYLGATCVIVGLLAVVCFIKYRNKKKT
ncbi:MAG: hypothetical protein RR441_07000 [Longicatena sp.]